jgi:hypothetical protein
MSGYYDESYPPSLWETPPEIPDPEDEINIELPEPEPEVQSTELEDDSYGEPIPVNLEDE